ncbi:phospho-N-acetylmuramoyl-pentapeptide-transferase [Candidatus Uabimicrobium sp. HlEnr_7]|uniref:phospho-N-acetylmuramoyl-pentapeptide- transferase n=1 Tax=Candidatus Uabimicrobium helgolandensis TaxID=3095367 RepID=UPI003558FDDE
MMFYLSISFTTRSLCAFIFSFLCAMVLIPLFIKLSKRNKLIEQMKFESQLMKEQSASKQNIPTMGGIVVIFSYLQAMLLCCDWQNIYLFIAMIVVFAFGMLGVSDDLIKTYTKNKGLSGKSKLLISVALAFAISSVLHFYVPSSLIFIPIWNTTITVTTVAWFVITIFVIVGTCHGVNLTDGMDGLATGCSLLVLFFFSAITMFAPQEVIVTTKLREIVVSNMALCGACTAFLWYNSYPAKIFMGDCGALMLGGYIGYAAVITGQHFLLAVVGGVFVVETLSSMLQICSKKYFARRIFLCAPLHHHFRAKGHSEPQLVVRFWICQIVLIIFSVFILQ